jgi:hypothetical protein
MSTLRHSDPTKPTAASDPWQPIKPLLRLMVALALGYVLLLAYLHYQGDADIQDPDIRRLFGGSAGTSTLKYVDRVEAYLIDHPAVPKVGVVGLLRYPITNGPISVSNSDARALKLALLDRRSYLWNVGKDCKPAYGARLDFIRSDHRVSVLLCFECDILATYLDDKFVAVEDFDGARPTVGRVVRSLFPDDQKIQSLLLKD